MLDVLAGEALREVGGGDGFGGCGGQEDHLEAGLCTVQKWE
jgi:hypothetical protein